MKKENKKSPLTPSIQGNEEKREFIDCKATDRQFARCKYQKMDVCYDYCKHRAIKK